MSQIPGAPVQIVQASAPGQQMIGGQVNVRQRQDVQEASISTTAPPNNPAVGNLQFFGGYRTEQKPQTGDGAGAAAAAMPPTASGISFMSLRPGSRQNV